MSLAYSLKRLRFLRNYLVKSRWGKIAYSRYQWCRIFWLLVIETLKADKIAFSLFFWIGLYSFTDGFWDLWSLANANILFVCYCLLDFIILVFICFFKIIVFFAINLRIWDYYWITLKKVCLHSEIYLETLAAIFKNWPQRNLMYPLVLWSFFKNILCLFFLNLIVKCKIRLIFYHFCFLLIFLNYIIYTFRRASCSFVMIFYIGVYSNVTYFLRIVLSILSIEFFSFFSSYFSSYISSSSCKYLSDLAIEITLWLLTTVEYISVLDLKLSRNVLMARISSMIYSFCRSKRSNSPHLCCKSEILEH